jgi:serine/threonine protein kinase
VRPSADIALPFVAAESADALAKVDAVDQENAPLAQLPQWACEVGAQPIPGYRLIEPLGRGGFGEVWKCEAPGGLFKAIKFVRDRGEKSGAAAEEQQALRRVKGIRHPFILSLERVETVDGVLVIVMELADKSLHSLLGDYQARNLPGIPREELLGYLLEAAEALDWMNFGHGLQHLDIKPHNLFLVSNHVKVADFGLVDRPSDVERSYPRERQGGMTPLYAAPELLCGTVSRHCDQYSLAIVYQQLLTGTVPFWCQNLYQLMVLHLSAEPNLTALPSRDREAIARALSKQPEERFPSCLDFLQALVCGERGGKVDLPRRAAGIKRLVSSLNIRAKSPNAAREPDVLAEPARDSERPATRLSPTVPMIPEEQGKKPSTVQAPVVRWAPSPDNTPSPRTEMSATPTCVSLPGYRFLECVAHTPLGNVWKAEDEQGRPRRALCLENFVEPDRQQVEMLQSVRYPALPRTEIAWNPSGRLVLVTDDVEQTLHDRMEACQKQGLPGIPREELLDYLRPVAEALDLLYQQHNLSHLGLNPRMLALQGGSVQVLDFGLVPLIWLPTGHTAGSLNGRYAAPELFDRPNLTGIPPGEATRAALLGRAGPASDQYSLALIYAELLNGIPPQAARSSSGLRRRPSSLRRGGSGPIVVRDQPRLDLDLLPTCDGPIFRRALHDNPEKRFPTCTALLEALENAASARMELTNLYHGLPAVIPFPSLQGEPPSREIVLPSLREFVLNLASPSLGGSNPPRNVVVSETIRYVRHENDIWECKCPVQVFSGAVALKVQGFQEEWHAKPTRERNDSFAFHIEIPQPHRPDSKDKALAAKIAFELDVQAATGSAKYFSEACMRVRPTDEGHEWLARLLPELAPRLFDSMRRYLHAVPEQRHEDRWPCPQPLRVYPVLRDLELDEILEGISRNISLRGVSLRVAAAPRTEQVYLHWHQSNTVSPYAVLAHVQRVRPLAGGGFEVGAAFPTSAG